MKFKLKGISLRTMSLISVIIAFVIALTLVISLYLLTSGYRDMNKSTNEYFEWEMDAGELEAASDYLTDEVRYYSINYDITHLQNYFNEAFTTKRREKALNSIKEKFSDTEPYKMLSQAMDKSIGLMLLEYHSMKLISVANGYDLNTLPEEVRTYELSTEELTLSNDEMIHRAQELVFGDEYNNVKSDIKTNVNNCINALDEMLKNKISDSSEVLKRLLIVQQAGMLVLVIFLIYLFLFIYTKIVNPIKHGAELISKNDFLAVEGVKEYKYFAIEYNYIRRNDILNNEKLAYEAVHDKLTSLYNRSGYYSMYNELKLDNLIYVLIDVDNFKQINDNYGHNIGDVVLKKIATTLKIVFENYGYVYRIGGDEFAILIEGIKPNSLDDIKAKIAEVYKLIENNENNIPKANISVGVAFGDINDTTSTLFKKADLALYHTKNNGRNGITLYDNSMKN